MSVLAGQDTETRVMALPRRVVWWSTRRTEGCCRAGCSDRGHGEHGRILEARLQDYPHPERAARCGWSTGTVGLKDNLLFESEHRLRPATCRLELQTLETAPSQQTGSQNPSRARNRQ